MRQRGEQLRLGLRQPLGVGQRAGPLGHQPLAVLRQGELPAQDAVDDHAQRHGQGHRAHGHVRPGPVARQVERHQRRGGGGQGHHQQSGEVRRGEEQAGGGAGDGHGQDHVAHRTGVPAEQAQLGDRQRPQQPAAEVQQAALGVGDLAAFQQVDRTVEGAPVQAELDEQRRHPDCVAGVGAGPDQHRQAQGEDAERIGQKLSLGVEAARVQGADRGPRRRVRHHFRLDRHDRSLLKRNHSDRWFCLG